ncbi:MAG: hypothetical protein ACK4RK_05670 [Gemmataceae bacterium]
MKKVFWCGCALVVTAATGIYWMADQCRGCTRAQLTQNVQSVCRAAVDLNPVTVMARGYHAQFRAMKANTSSATEETHSATCCCARPLVASTRSDDQPVQIIDLSCYAVSDAAGNDIHEKDANHYLFWAGSCWNPSSAASVCAHDGGQCSDSPSCCPDVSTSLAHASPNCPVPPGSCMPGCEHECEGTAPRVSERSPGVPDCLGELSETVDYGKPPTCRETPCYQQSTPECPAMPGCSRGGSPRPWMESEEVCIPAPGDEDVSDTIDPEEIFPEEDVPTREEESEEPPVCEVELPYGEVDMPYLDIFSVSEEQEEPTDDDSVTADPYHDDPHYGSMDCDYHRRVIVCPYSGKCYPVEAPVTTPTPTEQTDEEIAEPIATPEEVDDSWGEEASEPEWLLPGPSLPGIQSEAGNAGAMPAQPQVDTTECRPSDIPQGRKGPIPF